MQLINFFVCKLPSFFYLNKKRVFSLFLNKLLIKQKNYFTKNYPLQNINFLTQFSETMFTQLPPRFYYEADPKFEYYFIIEFVSCIQIVIEMLTIAHVIYILNIFLPTKACHQHFKIISCIFLFDLIVKSFMK